MQPFADFRIQDNGAHWWPRWDTGLQQPKLGEELFCFPRRSERHSFPHNVIGRRARGKCKPRILANGKRFGPSKSAALRPDAAWCMSKNGHSTFSAVAQLHQPTSASRQLALLRLFDLALIRVRIHRQRVSPRERGFAGLQCPYLTDIVKSARKDFRINHTASA